MNGCLENNGRHNAGWLVFPAPRGAKENDDKGDSCKLDSRYGEALDAPRYQANYEPGCLGHGDESEARDDSVSA